MWAYMMLMTDESPRSGWTAQATIKRLHRIRRQRRKTDVDLAGRGITELEREAARPRLASGRRTVHSGLLVRFVGVLP